MTNNFLFCKYHATYIITNKKKHEGFFRTGYEGSYAIVIRIGDDWFPSQSWASVKAYETTKRMCDAVLYNVHFVCIVRSVREAARVRRLDGNLRCPAD